MSMIETGLRPSAPVEELDAEAVASLERTRRLARRNRFKYAQGKSRRHDSKPRAESADYRQPHAD